MARPGPALDESTALAADCLDSPGCEALPCWGESVGTSCVPPTSTTLPTTVCTESFTRASPRVAASAAKTQGKGVQESSHHHQTGASWGWPLTQEVTSTSHKQGFLQFPPGVVTGGHVLASRFPTLRVQPPREMLPKVTDLMCSR